MSQLNAREPGLVGAALEDDRLFAGIICDGIHVDPTSLRVAFRCKGRDRLMLVTDAMPLVGTNDRQFMLQGRQITLHENRLTGPDGTLAGAHLTMIEAVRNAVALLEFPLSMPSSWPLGRPPHFWALSPSLDGSRPDTARTLSPSMRTLKSSIHGLLAGAMVQPFDLPSAASVLTHRPVLP